MVKEGVKDDYDALVEFWNKNSGWDQLTRAEWENRFMDTPNGPSIIYFLEKDNTILAKLIFVPFKVKLGITTYRGCRPFAAIIDKSIRGIFGFKYLGQVLLYGIKSMRKKGVDLLIMLPDPRWRRPLKLVDINLCNFPLYKLPIQNHSEDSVNSDIITKPIDFDNVEINVLWDKIKTQNINMVLRDQETLKWKNSHRNYQIIGVYKKDQLIGIATYLEKAAERQIQICDVLIPESNDQITVFTEVSHYINALYRDHEDFDKMVILVPELFKASLSEVGFVPDDYQFLFAIKRLNKHIPKEVLDISNWYLSAND